MLSALSADKALFNSKYNLNSFIDNLKSFFKLQPDYRPSISDLQTKITKKSCVMYFPLNISPPQSNLITESNDILHIVWPHRWEHDKNPNDFFECLFKLHLDGCNFRLSVLGESFTDVPEIFSEAKNLLSSKIQHFGRIDTKDDYFTVIRYAIKLILSKKYHKVEFRLPKFSCR